MQYATLDNDGVITGLFRCVQPFSTTEVPDHVAIGWTQIQGAWQKSEALLATEAEADADEAERTALKNAIALFKAGTATMIQVQRAIAYLLKRCA